MNGFALRLGVRCVLCGKVVDPPDTVSVRLVVKVAGGDGVANVRICNPCDVKTSLESAGYALEELPEQIG